MKKLCLVLIIAVASLSSCMEPEENIVPKPTFDASDGFTVGVIRLTFTDTPEGDAIAVERREKGMQEWQYIGSCDNLFFDDNYGYTQEDEIVGMPPKVFEYRARNSRYEYGALEERGGEEYSEIQEGFAYEIIPITEINIEKATNSNLLTWNAGNHGSFLNQSDIYFNVLRSEDSLGTYTEIARVGEDRSYFDDFTSRPELQGKKLYYRVDVYYTFELIMSSGGNHSESTTPIEGTVVAAPLNSSDNPEVSYTASPLGQVLAASSGNEVFDPKDKLVNGTLYIEAISGFAGAGGTPSLYKFNGASWEEVWTCSDLNQTMSSQFGVSSSGNSYVLGSSDSGTVYQWDGANWTNLGLPAEHDGYYALEVFNDEVHILIENGDVLQAHKYNGTNWSQVGADIASGSIFNQRLESINSTLYVTYIIDDVLYIKHLNGSSWDSDLQWGQEWLADIELAHTGSQLYFSSGSASSDFDGGVYRVTGSTTVENLIPEEHEAWFTLGAFDLTVDSEGDLIVASMKYEYADASQTSLISYPHLNLYDGTEWNTISGDFTDGVPPVTVTASGTDIYYIYGDASSVNSANDPASIRGMKLVK
ncbi:MAG: hypothetical protein GF372_14995 [Candidatus Marinimicrobia bacterium]|nr:hypothetical protein [Candidatus Neomarinimicrobiota bacterium]